MQFEGDAAERLFVVENVRQTPVELPSTIDDSSGGVQDPIGISASCILHRIEAVGQETHPAPTEIPICQVDIVKSLIS